MKYRWSFGAGLGLALSAMLAATPAVQAKEPAFQARLLTPIPANASPGDEIVLTWTLTYVDENMQSRPFNADNVFVQLLSANRAEPAIALATGGDPLLGEYVARVSVPQGGIAAVQFGIRGTIDTILPMDSEVPVPAVIGRPVQAGPSVAADVPVLGSWLGLLSLACLSVVAAIGRRRGTRVALS